MTFCWTCRECENRTTTSSRDLVPVCHGSMRRDWFLEGVGVGAGVRVSRDGSQREQAELFLPNNDEFAGPGDPDGTKGMREWHAAHRGKDGSADRSLVPGRIDKRTF
jgi:hypothetical protein